MAVARRLGQAIVDGNYELIYGGAEVGLMGEVANTVLKGGGVVRGIIPESFAYKVSHQGLTELLIVGTMHERKKIMFDMSDAFIALPGGYGTLEEVSELLTWAQLGLNSKPCGLINIEGYFNFLLSFLDNAVSRGFMKQQHRDMLLVASEPLSMLNQMASYKAPVVDKWVDESKQGHNNRINSDWQFRCAPLPTGYAERSLFQPKIVDPEGRYTFTLCR